MSLSHYENEFIFRLLFYLFLFFLLFSNFPSFFFLPFSSLLPFSPPFFMKNGKNAKKDVKNGICIFIKRKMVI